MMKKTRCILGSVVALAPLPAAFGEKVVQAPALINSVEMLGGYGAVFNNVSADGSTVVGKGRVEGRVGSERI